MFYINLSKVKLKNKASIGFRAEIKNITRFN